MSSLSVTLFRLAAENINNVGYGNITLRDCNGTKADVHELRVVPGTPGMAMARMTELFEGKAWWQYFAINDLLSFKVYKKDAVNEPEEDRD